MPHRDDTSEVDGFVRDLTIYSEADEVHIGCTMKSEGIGKLFFHISTEYPGLVFRHFVSEQVYAGFDQTIIFTNGRVLVKDSHDIDSPQAFFDYRGQVVKPGYTVITEDNRNLVYVRKDAELDEDYDCRSDSPEDMTIVLADDEGNECVVPMVSVQRFNKWESELAALKEKLSKEPDTKFNPGRIVSTKGVHDLMAQDAEFARFINLSLTRHFHGDWGNVCDGDRVENELALQDGNRLLSVYGSDGTHIWIVTEADRSATTVLFLSEY
jgi:hypothetical protein